MEKLADNVANEAQGVLPNRGQVARAEFSQADRPGKNQVGLLGFLQLAALPGSFDGKFTSKTGLSGKDVGGSYMVGAEYLRHDFPAKRLTGMIRMAVLGGSDEYSNGIDPKKISVSLSGFSLETGLGYHIGLRHRFSLLPALSLGYQVSDVELDYSGLSVAAQDKLGKTRTGSSLATSAPFAVAMLRLGYSLNRFVSLDLSFRYQQLIYEDALPAALLAGISAGFRL